MISSISGTHEEQSSNMINHLITSNNIKLDANEDDHNRALSLITSLITGDSKTWQNLLQPDEMFLTEIVSNKFCNIDVDKFDYILRDKHHVEEHVVLRPFEKFLDRSQIIFDDKGVSHIGYHAEDFELIENLFYNRSYLHMHIYQHKDVAGAEKMVKDICSKADAGGVTIDGFPLTQAHLDNKAYLKLDDSVLDRIKSSEIENKSVASAQKILKMLLKKQIYEMVWESVDDDAEGIFNALVDKFGDIFTTVQKFIPSADVPSNIPLYNVDGESFSKTSKLQLKYKSKMIYCTEPDVKTIDNVKSFIDSLNNNV